MSVRHSPSGIHTGLRLAARGTPVVLGVFFLLCILLLCIALLSGATLLEPGSSFPMIVDALPSSAWVILGGALGLFAMRRRVGTPRQRQWRARVYRLPSARRAALVQKNPVRRARCNSVPAIPFDSRSPFDGDSIASGSCRQRG